MSSWLLALTVLLSAASPAAAQGVVTPSFGNGELVIVAEGYRPGERVELTVRAGGVSHQFTVTADALGCFRLDTGLVIPPLSSLEIEARDESGGIQATLTGAPVSLPVPEAGDEESTGEEQEVDPDLMACGP